MASRFPPPTAPRAALKIALAGSLLLIQGPATPRVAEATPRVAEATQPTATAPEARNSPVGLTQKHFHDAERDRPVWVDLWYPAVGSSQEVRKFSELGFAEVAVDAELAPTRTPYPLVVLSHGANGSAVNYSWLATRLAQNGYLVLGVSHYGESWRYGPNTLDPQGLLRMWLRPRDLSFALDRLLEVEPFATATDRQRIAAIGHSSGGATVLDLGGALSNPIAMGAYCASPAAVDDRGCQYSRELGIVIRPKEFATSQRDPRIRALVALDPALGPAFDAESLAAIDLPTLIVGAVDNDFLPYENHAGRIGSEMPQAQLIELDQGEGHFVFLDACQSNLTANGVPLCRDSPGVDREAVHLTLGNAVLEFLAAAIPPDPVVAVAPAARTGRRVFVLVDRPDEDPRVEEVNEALAFWAETFRELGVANPLSEPEIFAADDRSIENYAWQISRGAGRHVSGSAAPLVPAALINLEAEVVILLSKHPLMPFAWKIAPDRFLIAIPAIGTASIPAPNRDVVAHEIGHALGLSHQADPSLLMCHPCSSQRLENSPPRRLSDQDIQTLIETNHQPGVATFTLDD